MAVDIERPYLIQCRDCGHWYWSARPSSGSKWTSLCWSCLQGEL